MGDGEDSFRIGHFRVAVKLIVKARLSVKFSFLKVSFHSYAIKTNFHVKSFALSLAFIMRFTATRKSSITNVVEMSDSLEEHRYSLGHLVESWHKRVEQ